MKLHCLQLAGGDVGSAQRMYEWLNEQAPAQPVHPDAELRSVTPATEEERGDQSASETAAKLQGKMESELRLMSMKASLKTSDQQTEEAAAGSGSGDDQGDGVEAPPGGVEGSRDHLIDAQTCEEVDPRCSWKAEPEIPDALAEFMKLPGAVKWGGGVYGDFVKQNPDLNYTETEIEVLFKDGRTFTGLSGGFLWNHTFEPDDIIAYRIISTPAAEPEQDAGVETGHLPEGFTRWEGGEWTGHPRDAVQVVFESGAVSDVSYTVEDEARFWHWPWDGKSDRIIAFKIVAPAPAPEPNAITSAVESGAITQSEADMVADARERIAADEQAKFFGQGMMADADRHAQERSMMEKAGEALAAIFKREREDA